MKKTWAEEHEDFVRRSSEIRPGPKWTLGFLQVIPDVELPATKLQNNSLKDFLVPEQYLSLKLYFDNLRNFAICAAFLALGVWVWSSAGQKLPIQVPGWLPRATAIAIWAFAGVLLLLNCAQTWVLARELSQARRQIAISRTYIYAPKHSLLFIPAVFHMAFLWIFDSIGVLFALLVSVTLIAMSLGLAAFIALSK